MKRPAFQFYPADWRKDTALQLCSIAARGLWWEMICLMHEAEPYGHLVAAGVALDAHGLARLVGESSRDVARWLRELEQKQVYSVTEAGIICSRRMVRDERERSDWRDRQNKHRDKARDVTPHVTPPSQASHAVLLSSSSSSSSNHEVSTPTGTAAVDNSASKPRVDTPQERKPKVNGTSAWAKTNDGIERKAQELGIKPLPGEGHDALKRRCFEVEMKRHRGKQ